ncbi:BTAD domain-containing putative transcriptional regulator [Streptomyces capparidis]
MDGLEFRLLGPVGVWEEGRHLGPATAQQRTVLATLLLDPGRAVPVDRLATALWGTERPDSARNAIQGHISRLRRLLAPWPDVELTTTPQGYRLAVDRARVDLHQFRDLVREARRSEPEPAVKLLRSALALWRGPALAEVSGRWLPEAVGAGLEEERLTAVEERAGLDLRAGRHEEVVEELSALVAEHPLRERPLCLLLTALHQCGRRADALALFRRVRQRFVDELGIEPGEEAQRVHQAVLSGQGAVGQGAVGQGAVGQAPGGHAAAAGQVAGGGQAAGPERVPPQPADGQPFPAPRQLPLDTEYFTGREAELAALDALALDAPAPPAGRPPGRAVICLVTGAGGVGKTALAVHWAHRVRERFPDGQLYVNLRGFGPAETALPPPEALRTLLDAFRLPHDRIPDGFEAQTALYRELLAERRLLILLDNARDADQVRPLLPDSPGSVVLVTSRSELSGLVVADGAHPLPLDLLSAPQSRQLLLRRLGRRAADAAPEAVDGLVTMCSGLPLALAVMAAHAVAHPASWLETPVPDPREIRGTLDAFDTGDASTDLRTVFSWSYAALSPDAARLFRLLGLADVPDITLDAAASLAGVPVPAARKLLGELTRAHLVGERSLGRYFQHDLLWAYARELTQLHDPPPDHRAALKRLLDHYLHSAWHAGERLDWAYQVPITLAPPGRGVAVTRITDRTQALAWFRAEQPKLLAASRQAARCGFDVHTWQLARAACSFLTKQGLYDDQAAMHRLGLTSAERLADPHARAWSHLGLGHALSHRGHREEGNAHMRRGLALFESMDHHIGQAIAHNCLGHAYLEDPAADPREGLRHCERALELNRAAGHRVGEGRNLNNTGWLYAQLGQYETALRRCEEALEILTEVGDAVGESAALDSLGYVHHHLGNADLAIGHYERALAGARGEDQVRTAQTLTRLGEARLSAGRRAEGLDALRSALAILTDVAHPDAESVRARLGQLTPGGP